MFEPSRPFFRQQVHRGKGRQQRNLEPEELDVESESFSRGGPRWLRVVCGMSHPEYALPLERDWSSCNADEQRPDTVRQELRALPEEVVGGVRVLNASVDDLVGLAEAAIAGAPHPPLTVAFVNPHSVEGARRNPEAFSAFHRVDFPAPDGVFITLASKVLGGRIRTRYSGIDLLRRMLPKPGISHFFLGSNPEVSKSLSERVRANLGKESTATFHPLPTWPWPSAEDEKLVRRINDFGPDILWVGLSAPNQELWMMRNARALNVSMVAAIGYAFDTYSGTKPLAPEWIRTLGFEWLFRFVQSRGRTWRRIFVSAPLFAYRVVQRRLWESLGLAEPTNKLQKAPTDATRS